MVRSVVRATGGGIATLANHWHPIARSEAVIERPQRFTLLGTDLVAFRTGSGVSVFTDLCIHRGVALSLGSVENGVLRCGYHGWAYGRDGVCVEIPSLPPGAPIPSMARAITHEVVEKYGLVWVALDEPLAGLAPFPSDEWNRPDYRTFVSQTYRWNTSAGRAVENFMDVSHFPFVHEGTLGSRDSTEVSEHRVENRDGILYYYVEAPEPAELHSQDGDLIRWEYFLTGPFTIHLRKTLPSGEETLISMAASPVEEKTTDLFLWIGRNYQLDPDDDKGFVDFTHDIMEQDRRIVESQRPEQIPVDLREELHLKVPDASGIAYRRHLGAIEGVSPFLP